MKRSYEISENISCVHNLKTNKLMWQAKKLPTLSLIATNYNQGLKLWNFTNESSKTAQGHQDWVTCLLLLPNDEIATGSDDRTIRIWKTESLLYDRSLIGHTDSVNCLLLLSENEFLSGSDDRTIKIWNIINGLCIKTLDSCESSIRSFVRFPLKDLIVSSSADCYIRIWDLKLSECIYTIFAHTETLFSLLALKNGYLASSSCDKTIKIWDINTGLSINTLLGHTDQVWSLAELMSGELVSSSCDKTIKIWDQRKSYCVKTLRDDYDIELFTSLLVAPNGQLVSGSCDRLDNGILRVWDLQKGVCIKKVEDNKITILCLIFV